MSDLAGWRLRRFLPVLMYHRIGVPPAEGSNEEKALWVPEPALRRQLGWLKAAGYRTLSLDEAYDCLRHGRAPSRSVLLTVDDAWAETLDPLSAALRDTGTRAALFVVADQVGRAVTWTHPNGRITVSGNLADADQLHEWLALGFDVGSHSSTHADLTLLAPEEVFAEAASSRRSLADLLDREMLDFCYPFTHHDAAAREQVARAGYRMAFAGEPARDDLWAVPRMMVFSDDSERRFRRKLSGYYYWLSGWHRRLGRRRDVRSAEAV